jgi:hypothetical protein
MNLLFPELEDCCTAVASSGDLTARSWCDPSKYGEVVGLDFGSNSVNYYMARSKRHGKMPFKKLFAWLVGLPPRTLVVCESAHLGVPQTERSLAQPFTAGQLLQLYQELQRCNITLMLAPHAHTGKRMRLWVAYNFPALMKSAEKTDAADALAVAVYVDLRNDISLLKPYRSFARSPKREFGRKVTELSNRLLNAERTDDYHGDFYPLVIKLARKVRSKGGFPSLKFVVTVASTLLGEREGRLVLFTHRGYRPGRWFWMRDVLRMSPWHHRGGTARSNRLWHTFKPYLQRHAKRAGVSVKSGSKYQKFAVYDDRQNAARCSAMKSFRKMLLRCRELCLAEAEKMVCGILELTDSERKEATDGPHP